MIGVVALLVFIAFDIALVVRAVLWLSGGVPKLDVAGRQFPSEQMQTEP